MRDHLCRMAQYNRWANRRLFDACVPMPDEVYYTSRKMFFGSIHGTLNHILIADRLWLARIEQLPVPDYALDDQPYAEMASLRKARDLEDERMIALTETYSSDADLETILHYRPITMPADVSTARYLCWLHLFNHQTHHRGQIHDQISQADMAPPPLDLMFYLREEA